MALPWLCQESTNVCNQNISSEKPFAILILFRIKFFAPPTQNFRILRNNQTPPGFYFELKFLFHQRGNSSGILNLLHGHANYSLFTQLYFCLL